jgi:hypothetical protein
MNAPTLSSSRSRQRVAAAAAALLASSGLWLAAAAPSQAAGTYVNLGCDATATSVNDGYGGWAKFGDLYNGLNVANECPNNGLHVDFTASTPLGHSAGWTYTAPSGTFISGVNMLVKGWLRAYLDPAGDPQPNQGMLQIGTDGSANLANWTSAQNGALWPNGATIASASLHANALGISILCDGPTGAPGCSAAYQTGWVRTYAPKLYLGDDLAPTVGTVTGAATTDTTWKATKNLAYAATDGGSGIARFRLYVDGTPVIDHVVDNSTGHCQVISTDNGAWVFGYSKPCPASVNVTEALDSTTIADGQHTIVAKVVDAAQREATIINRSAILVANHPPVLQTAPVYTAATAATAGAPVTGVAIAVQDATFTGPNLTYTRGWQQCDSAGATCAQIPGATSLSYTPSTADIGHKLRYAVTASNVADSVTSYTTPTGVVVAPSSSEAPTVKPADGADGNNGANGSNGSSTTTNTTNTTTTSTDPAAPTLAAPAAGADHTPNGRVDGQPAGEACDQAVLLVQHVNANTIKLGYGKASTAQLELTCKNTGKPISEAKLEIATRVVGQPVVAADVSTDGAGHATLRLAKGASRGITVGYRMYADDPIARATTTLKVLVTGRLSLKASTAHLHNGQAVTLKGTLAGGLVPKRGVTLAVQWKDGKHWRPFAQIKANHKGAFKYAYKFTRTTKKVTYRLRVQVAKGQVDYPFQAPTSKTVKVTVAP